MFLELCLVLCDANLGSGEDKRYLKANERYYFVKREKASTNVKGKRPKRSLEGDFDGGWWKATVGDKEIRIKDRLMGYKQTLTFYSYKNKKRNRKEAVKTDWIMHEYKLATDTFQEWVLCRIKDNAKSQEKKPGETEIDEEEEEEEDQTQQNSSVNGGVFNVGESSTTTDDELYAYLMNLFSVDEEFH